MSLVHWNNGHLEHVGYRCANVAGSLGQWIFGTRWVPLCKRRWFTGTMDIWNTLGIVVQTSLVHWDNGHLEHVGYRCANVAGSLGQWTFGTRWVAVVQTSLVHWDNGRLEHVG